MRPASGEEEDEFSASPRPRRIDLSECSESIKLTQAPPLTDVVALLRNAHESGDLGFAVTCATTKQYTTTRRLNVQTFHDQNQLG